MPRSIFGNIGRRIGNVVRNRTPLLQRIGQELGIMPDYRVQHGLDTLNLKGKRFGRQHGAIAKGTPLPPVRPYDYSRQDTWEQALVEGFGVNMQRPPSQSPTTGLVASAGVTPQPRRRSSSRRARSR